MSPFKGSFKGDIRPYEHLSGLYWQYFGLWVCYVGCFIVKGVSESVQVLLHGIEAVLVLTLILLK